MPASVSPSSPRFLPHHLYRCLFGLKAARKQFGASASEVFRFWRMKDITDIRKIVAVLVNTEYAPAVKDLDQKEFERPLTLLEILELV
jgi:hypothetical protein